MHGQYKDDNYLGSGLHLKRQISKYGKENFKRESLYIFNTEKEAFQKEKELLKEHLLLELCLNISEGGDGGANFLGKKHSNETIEKA